MLLKNYTFFTSFKKKLITEIKFLHVNFLAVTTSLYYLFLLKLENKIATTYQREASLIEGNKRSSLYLERERWV